MGTLIPRDLPLCSKVRVFKVPDTGLWTWEHRCTWHGHDFHGGLLDSQPLAFKNALIHLSHCEVA